MRRYEYYDDFRTTASQGCKARTGHFGAGQRGSKRRTASPACEYRKGKCKTAAQKALAQLEYAPAAPLWAKLVKGKWMGSHIMSDACSDCVSEQIAPVILKTLSLLLDEADTKPLEEGQVEQMNFCFHLMLGKASPKMLEVYRFLAEMRNGSAISSTPPFMMVTNALHGTFPKDWGSIK